MGVLDGVRPREDPMRTSKFSAEQIVGILHPHSALGYRTPDEIRAAFRATTTTTTMTTTQIEDQTTGGLS